MGLSRTPILLLIPALIGPGMLVRQPPSPPLSLSRWDGAMPEARARAPQSIGAAFAAQPAAERPSGNPLRDRRTVITQGDGVGSHAPAGVWGGIDLAIDSDGDGKADPQGTWHVPVDGAHDGIARVKPNTWPGGNYLAIAHERDTTADAHLDS